MAEGGDSCSEHLPVEGDQLQSLCVIRARDLSLVTCFGGIWQSPLTDLRCCLDQDCASTHLRPQLHTPSTLCTPNPQLITLQIMAVTVKRCNTLTHIGVCT